MEPEEEWRPVKGYEGYYEVSNKCRIRSIERFGINRHKNGKKFVHGKLKYTEVCNTGREVVQLSKNGINKKHPVYRLMAIAFLPNPNNYPEINHKDENPLNCSLDNLEWCEHKYNCNYGTRNRRISISKFKRVAIYKNGVKVREFESQKEASEYLRVSTGYLSSAIRFTKPIKGYTIKRL